MIKTAVNPILSPPLKKIHPMIQLLKMRESSLRLHILVCVVSYCSSADDKALWACFAEYQSSF